MGTTGGGRSCRLRVGDHELPTQNTILNGLPVEASSERAQMLLMAPSYTLHVRNDRDHGMDSPTS